VARPTARTRAFDGKINGGTPAARHWVVVQSRLHPSLQQSVDSREQYKGS
jgi:hypothetical protein